MDVPRPTVAPPGRLVRLGVVLDTRNPIERLREVARMCDRAGIGALWVEDVEEAGVGPAPAAGVGDAGDDAPRLDAWTALALLAGEVRSARIGAVLDAAAWPAARPAPPRRSGPSGRPWPPRPFPPRWPRPPSPPPPARRSCSPLAGPPTAPSPCPPSRPPSAFSSRRPPRRRRAGCPGRRAARPPLPPR